jgi:cysteine-rich repeat protein
MAWAGRGGHRVGLVALLAGVVALQAGCSNDTGQTPVTDATGSLVTDSDSTGDTSTAAGTEPTTTEDTSTGPALQCGNGEVDPGETCDDGNLDNSDACLNSCVLAVCGDGFVQSGAEECDDGNSDNSDTCTAQCQPARCGDGFVQLGAEACDDGNSQDDDGCTSACEVAPVMLCGNGKVDDGEACDDGNTLDDDNCLSSCVPYSCGDGFTHAVFEECDDANLSADDGCIECMAAYCGDGYLWPDMEACDDGNLDNNDDCLVDCSQASCGDGFVHNSDEACDDGVNDGGYGGCAPGCASLGPHCGDGQVEPDIETCDDGNVVPLDGCDDKCQKELPAECLTYVPLAEPDRNATFNDGPGKVTKCDKVLENKWYRLTGPAGTLMPTTPLKPFDCGTDAPGWMVGVHPIVDEGVVDRQVCFAWDVECQWEATIQVRNCGDYYVYRLADPPDECLRYCGLDG